MRNIVVLSGAGISAESGIKTFRDANGLWENHKIEDVATPQAWEKNPTLVLKFYNERRKQLQEVKPNLAHQLVADLEKNNKVQIITQNVDDLHERAGSTNVLHLHGELLKSRSTKNESLIFEQNKDIKIGDLATDGSQLRPHIVWFGEMVPMLEQATKIVSKANVLIIIGTSLQVYPAAGLYEYASKNTMIYVINPIATKISNNRYRVSYILENATEGMQQLYQLLEY